MADAKYWMLRSIYQPNKTNQCYENQLIQELANRLHEWQQHIPLTQNHYPRTINDPV